MAKKPKAPKLQEATPKLGGAFAGQQYFYNEKGEVVDQTGAIQTPVQLAKIKPFLNEYDPNYGKKTPKPVRQRQTRRPIQPTPTPVTPPPPPPPAEEPVATSEIESTQPSTVSETPPETTQNEKPGLVRRAAGAVRRNSKPFAKFAGRKFLQSSFPDLYNLHQEYQAYKKKNRNKNLDDQENKTKADNKSSEDKRTQADIKAGLDLTNTLMKDSSYLIRQSLSNEERITTLLSEISSTLSQIKWLLILKGGMPSIGGGLLAAETGASALGAAALPLAVGGVLLGLGIHRRLAQDANPEGADVFDRTISSGSKRAETINGPEAEQQANPNIDVSRQKISPVDFLIKNGLAKTESEARSLIDYIKGDIIVLKDGRWWDNKEQVLHASPAPIDKNGKKINNAAPVTPNATRAYAAGTPPVTPQGPVAPRNALAELNQTKNITAAKENTLEKNNHVSVESDDMLFKSSKITFDTQKFTLDAKSVEAIKNDNQNNRESQGATPAVPGGGSTPPSSGSSTTPGSGAGAGSSTSPGGGSGGSSSGPSGSSSSTPSTAGAGTQTPGGTQGGPQGSPGSTALTEASQKAPPSVSQQEVITKVTSWSDSGDMAKVLLGNAMRESGLNPASHNNNPQTRDDSHGLWQYNRLGGEGANFDKTMPRGSDIHNIDHQLTYLGKRLNEIRVKGTRETLREFLNNPNHTLDEKNRAFYENFERGKNAEQDIAKSKANIDKFFKDIKKEDGAAAPVTPGAPAAPGGEPQTSPDPIQQQRQHISELRDTGFRAFAEGTPKIDPLDAARGVAGIAARHTPIVGNVLSGLSAARNAWNGNYKGMIGDAASAFTPFGLGGIVTDQVIPDSINRKPQENIKPTPGAMPRSKKQEPRLPRESAKAAIQQQQRDPQLTLPPSRMSKLNKTKNPSAMHDQNIQRSYRVHDPAGKISKEIGF